MALSGGGYSDPGAGRRRRPVLSMGVGKKERIGFLIEKRTLRMSGREKRGWKAMKGMSSCVLAWLRNVR